MSNSFYETDMAILKEYGVQLDQIEITSIRTGDSPGPTVMSNDPNKSHVKAQTITVESIHHLKRIGGIPDRAFKDGQMNSNLPTPASYNPEQSSINTPYDPTLCAAYKAFMFGNSERVVSYEETINDLRFPVTMSVFTGEDIVVTAGSPLIIRDEEGHGDPIALVYNKITVEPGGQIIWEAPGKLTAKEMIFQEPVGRSLDEVLKENGTEQNFISKGADGEDGPEGPFGPDGPDGPDGNKGKDNKNSCARDATDGTKGGDGVDGSDGSDGSNGGDGNNVNNTFDILTGTINVGSGGGKGGNGGKGGDGGKGGKGGNGGAATDNCKSGKGKNGGNGGKAGDGGAAGAGGDGQDVFITYLSGDPTFVLKQATGGAGVQGTAGARGAGGAAGTPGGEPGVQGDKGEKGATAEPGIPGRIYINGEELKG